MSSRWSREREHGRYDRHDERYDRSHRSSRWQHDDSYRMYHQQQQPPPPYPPRPPLQHHHHQQPFATGPAYYNPPQFHPPNFYPPRHHQHHINQPPKPPQPPHGMTPGAPSGGLLPIPATALPPTQHGISRHAAGHRQMQPRVSPEAWSYAVHGFDTLFEKHVRFPRECFATVSPQDVFVHAEEPIDPGMLCTACKLPVCMRVCVSVSVSVSVSVCACVCVSVCRVSVPVCPRSCLHTFPSNLCKAHPITASHASLAQRWQS